MKLADLEQAKIKKGEALRLPIPFEDCDVNFEAFTNKNAELALVATDGTIHIVAAGTHLQFRRRLSGLDHMQVQSSVACHVSYMLRVSEVRNTERVSDEEVAISATVTRREIVPDVVKDYVQAVLAKHGIQQDIAEDIEEDLNDLTFEETEDGYEFGPGFMEEEFPDDEMELEPSSPNQNGRDGSPQDAETDETPDEIPQNPDGTEVAKSVEDPQ